jgi:hypothetical protein
LYKSPSEGRRAFPPLPEGKGSPRPDFMSELTDFDKNSIDLPPDAMTRQPTWAEYTALKAKPAAGGQKPPTADEKWFWFHGDGGSIRSDMVTSWRIGGVC